MSKTAVSQIQGIGRFKFDKGQLEEFKRLAAQVVDIVQNKDTGTLQFEIYLNADESEGIVLERYRDSDALIEHGTHLGALGQAIPGLVSSDLLGEPSAEIKTQSAGTGVHLFKPFLSL